MARDVESYVHRIGRTVCFFSFPVTQLVFLFLPRHACASLITFQGRAGKLGDSVTFWNPDYDKVCTPPVCHLTCFINTTNTFSIQECAPALIKIAKDSGNDVPAWLAKYEKTKAAKTWKVQDAVLK